MNPLKSSGGFTMLELLLVISMSSVLVLAAAYFFNQTNRGLMGQRNDIKGLYLLYEIEFKIQNQLGKKIKECRSNDISIQEKKDIQLGRWLKSRYPQILSLQFECLEKDAVTGKIERWMLKPKPDLVEYQGELQFKGNTYPIIGSMLIY